jgi:glycosyltransferase involved in cell wall biosynthesis
MDNRIRIMHVMTRLPVGGAENALFATLPYYAPERYEQVIVCLSEQGEIGRRMVEQGYEVICLGKLGHQFRWSITTDIKRIVRERGIQIVASHQYHGNLYGRIGAWRGGAKCISAFVQSTYRRDKKPHRKLINHLLGRVTDFVFGPSDAVCADIIRYDRLPPEKVRNIPNGIDPERFEHGDGARVRAELGIPVDAPVVGTVGRIHDPKGHEFLVEAMALLRADHPGLRCIIAGDGPLRGQIEAQIKRLGLEDVVLLLGTRSDIPDVLAAMDVYAMPSLWEGQGLALVEAMAAGVPAVASDIQSLRETSGGDASVIHVPVKDSRALAQGIATILGDPEGSRERARLARQVVYARHTAAASVRSYCSLYEGVLRSKGVI